MEADLRYARTGRMLLGTLEMLIMRVVVGLDVSFVALMEPAVGLSREQ
jgi:hypothetical protein